MRGPDPHGWYPMESAPRDGTRFDVWVPSDNGGYRVCDVSFKPNGSILYSRNREIADLARWPTHWREIPSSPLTEDGVE